MQIAVTFRHTETDEGLKGYVKEKVEKLQKYIENPTEVHVVLSAEKFRHIAEITINGDGMTFNSQGRDSDLYAAVDQMVDKIERQIRERREKRGRKRMNLSPQETSRVNSEGFQAGKEEGEEEPTIQRRRYLAKPMSPEEAVAQLNLSEQEIIFFINTHSGQINALRRQGDGSYEWIEPQPE